MGQLSADINWWIYWLQWSLLTYYEDWDLLVFEASYIKPVLCQLLSLWLIITVPTVRMDQVSLVRAFCWNDSLKRMMSNDRSYSSSVRTKEICCHEWYPQVLESSSHCWAQPQLGSPASLYYVLLQSCSLTAGCERSACCAINLNYMHVSEYATLHHFNHHTNNYCSSGRVHFESFH